MQQPEKGPLLIDQPCLSLFNYGPKSVRDRGWFKAYLLLVWLCTLGATFACFFADWGAPLSINTPLACPKPVHNRQLLQQAMPWDISTIPAAIASAVLPADPYLTHPYLLSSLSLAGSILLSIGLVLLLKKSASGVVKASICGHVLLGLVYSADALDKGARVLPACMLCLTAAAVYLLWCMKKQLASVAKLLGTAALAVTECPGVTVLLLGLAVVAAVVLLCAWVTLGWADMNGRLVYNPARDMVSVAPDPVTSILSWAVSRSELKSGCPNRTGDMVACCVVQPYWWVPAFKALVAFTGVWTCTLLGEVFACTAAGTICTAWYILTVATPVVTAGRQWYLANKGSTPRPSRGESSCAMRSLGYSLASSLGSLCLTSAMMAVMLLLCWLLASHAGPSDGDVFSALFTFPVASMGFIMAAAVYLIRLTVARLAITGEGFADAGKATISLLEHKGVDVFAVAWMPLFIIKGAAFLMIASYALSVWLVGYLAWGRDSPPGTGSVWLLAGVAYVGTLVALAVVWALLLNTFYAAFVCTNMEIDGGGVAHPHMQQANDELPSHTSGSSHNPGSTLADGAAPHVASHVA